MKTTVVLYPVSGMGHVVPVVELAKLFLLHDFAVTVVLMHSPIYHPSLDPSLARLSAAYPSMSFHSLPPPLPPSPPPAAPTSSHYWRISDLTTRSYSTSLSPTAALPMSAPSSSTSSASPPSSASRLTSSYPPAPPVLPSFFTLPTSESTTEPSLCELGDALVHFPGLPPIAVSNMPNHLVDRTGETYKRLVILFQRMLVADSIFINSFEPLESEAVKALHAGLAFPVARCRKCIVSGR